MLQKQASSTASGTVRRAAAPLPLRVPTWPYGGQHCQHQRGALVIRRFKEDELKEDMMARRKAQEDVIKKQEETLQEAQEVVKETAYATKEALKGDESAHKTTAELNKAARHGFLPGIVGTHGGLKGYAPDAFRLPMWMPAYTRRREAFIGRIAMLGFVGVCVVEAMVPYHPGIITQASMWTHLSDVTVRNIIAGIAAYYLVGGLLPWSPTWSAENILDVAKRPTGPPLKLVSPLDLGRFFGISGWGFTKRNELFHGRIAMLAFAWALLGELATGMGPLAQLATNLHVLPTEDYYHTVGQVFMGFVAVAVALAVLFGSKYQSVREDEIF